MTDERAAVMPEEPSRVLLAVMRDALIDGPVSWVNVYARERHIYAALRAELMKPLTKTVWRVTYLSKHCDFDCLDTAMRGVRSAVDARGAPVTVEPVEVPR